MHTIAIPQMLLIAGTGRNTGKTTLVCDILRKFSTVHSIIALKITPHFHGNIKSGNVIISSDSLCIAEETETGTGKDSSLMLLAGATKSYFVMASDASLGNALHAVIPVIPSGSLIVCESGGLRSYVKPGLFFMMRGPGTDSMKPSAEKFILLADRVITFDGENIDFDLDSIEISESRWILK